MALAEEIMHDDRDVLRASPNNGGGLAGLALDHGCGPSHQRPVACDATQASRDVRKVASLQTKSPPHADMTH